MNDPGYVSTNESLNSRVFTYDNVRFADNYYQQDGNYEPISLTPDFDGVVANGAYNLQLPSAVLENGGSSLEHSDVHTWYYGTITQPFSAGYAGFSGSGRNNDGDVAFPEAWWGSSGVPARASTGFAFSQIGGTSRNGLPTTGGKIAAGPVPTVFNGDFAVAINQGTDSVQGWQWHDDNGTAPLGGTDLYIELNSGGDGLFPAAQPALPAPPHRGRRVRLLDQRQRRFAARRSVAGPRRRHAHRRHPSWTADEWVCPQSPRGVRAAPWAASPRRSSFASSTSSTTASSRPCGSTMSSW